MESTSGCHNLDTTLQRLQLFEGVGRRLRRRRTRDYRLGWRLTPAASGDTGFELSLDAPRRQTKGDNEAEHGVMLRNRIRW